MTAEEGPVGPHPVEEFAAALRALRERAGSPTFRAMSKRSGVSVGALHQAAKGEVFPSLRVATGFVLACDGDLARWEGYWRRTKEALDRRPREEGDQIPPPYLGLSRFEPKDSDLFFGREQLVDQLHELTRRFPFTAVFGPSGSGKSSLLRAGLIPRLREGNGEGPRPARVRILTPGAHPMARRERLVPDEAPGPTYVLVDQFEELFTLCQDPGERADFIEALLSAGQPDSRLRVVIAVRADFLGQCAQHAGLTEVLQRATLLTGPMNREELQRAVVQPAIARGFQVQRSLTQRVIREVEDEPGALPLMSHAMLETWRHRRGHMLTETAYDATGGLHGAIAKTAEKVYAGFSPEEAEQARRVLLRLVAPGDGTPDTRRPTDRAELGAELDRGGPGQTTTVVDRLVEARLLTLDDGVVDLAHEALITAWPRLRGWIDSERDRLRLHRQLTQAARDWETLDQDPGALYRGSRLASAREAFPEEISERELTPSEREFLRASRHQYQRKVRWRRTVTAVLAALCLIASVAAVVAVQQRETAQSERNTAMFQQMVTKADGLRDSRRSLAARLDVAARGMDSPADLETRLLSDAGATLSTPLSGHHGVVSSTSFSPDGKTLASGGHDRKVRLWDTSDPLRARPLGSPPGRLPDRVEDVRFGRGGRLLAAALHDRTVRLWDTSRPRSPRPLGGPLRTRDAAPTTLAFSPKGDVLVTGAEDGALRLWDLDDPAHPEPLGKPLKAHQGGVQAVTFSPDGDLLASGGRDEALRLWDVSRPGRVRELGDGRTAHHAPVWSVAFSPDGDSVATGGFDATVRLWDVHDPKRARQRAEPQEHEAPVWSVEFSPDGKSLLSGGEDNTVRLWNVVNPDYPQPLGDPMTGHQGGVWSVGFRPGDPHTLTSAGYSGDLMLWHRPHGVMTDFTNPLTSLAHSPDGRLLATASTDDGAIRLWNVRHPDRPRLLRRLEAHDDRVTSVAFAPDGKTLASGGEDDTVRLWDLDDPAHPAPLGKPLKAHREPVLTVAFAPDGRTLASGGADRTVRLWQLRGRKQPRPAGTLSAQRDGTIHQLAFAPDGRTLATAHEHSTVRLWGLRDHAAPRPLRRLTGHQERVFSVAFSPDGRTLASGGEDRALRLWDVARPDRARRLGKPLNGHAGKIDAVVFSPDGDRLATASGDRTVRLWDVHDRRHPRTWGQPLTGHTSTVTTVSFSPDGTTLASAGYDLTTRLWSLDVDGAEHRVCARTRGLLNRTVWEEQLPRLPYPGSCENAH
ncbi:WD40 repeat domain-containing protein [Streptomyces sp. NPDC005438]|uniref:nSTAND1 domain-containing NTPase n=1 Tax=Streptomyces sp. NPDC005438 TaxID=3156880 RepID=UPI0033BBA8A3